MTEIRKLIRYSIYLNLIVALSTGVLCAGYSHLSGIDNWLSYGFFAFFSTLAVYNGQRLFKSRDSFRTPWLEWVNRHRIILFALAGVSTLIALSILFELEKRNLQALSILGISGLISTFYVFKVHGKNMREIPYIKIHLIAISWVMILIVFPVQMEGIEPIRAWSIVAHYCYVVAVTIPFDIRDLKYDSPSQKTIPQVLGVNNARLLALFLMFVFAVFMLYQMESIRWNALFYLAVLIQMILIIGMNEKRSDLYCAGLIDGSIALLGLSYFSLF